MQCATLHVRGSKALLGLGTQFKLATLTLELLCNPCGSHFNGLFYVERVGRAQADGSEIGYGVLIYFFHRSPSFSFSFIHHCFGVFCMIRTIRSFPTHRPCIYILLSSAGTSSLDVYHALEPDLQPKKLCLSIPNIQRALRCPPYSKYKG